MGSIHATHQYPERCVRRLCKGRIYLPLEDLHRYGISEQDVLDGASLCVIRVGENSARIIQDR